MKGLYKCRVSQNVVRGLLVLVALLAVAGCAAERSRLGALLCDSDSKLSESL